MAFTEQETKEIETAVTGILLIIASKKIVFVLLTFIWLIFFLSSCGGQGEVNSVPGTIDPPLPSPTTTQKPTTTPTTSPTLTPRNTAIPLATSIPTATLLPTPQPMNEWLHIGTGEPSARSGMSFAYDDVHNEIIMFGGTCAGYACDDTWKYSPEDGWRQIHINGPSALETAYMAYDSHREKVVLFGGHVWAGSHLGDTWEFDGENWGLINTATLPPSRSNHAIAFDPSQNKVVLFGGWFNSQLGDDILGDTWEFDGVDWNQVETITSPSPRSNMKLVYSPDLNGLLLFGGIGREQMHYNDTWLYKDNTWTKLTPSHSPPARFGYQMAFDPSRQEIVLFGGTHFSDDFFTYTDTWVYDGNDWQLIETNNTPPPTWNAGFVYSPMENGFLMFGGNSPHQNDLTNDIWFYGIIP